MRAQRRDANEGPIRKRAEALGFLWLENNASTKGRPDVCLLRRGATYWCEVKMPGEPFTHAQMETFAEMKRYGVPVHILTSAASVSQLDGGMLEPWTGEDVKVWSLAGGRKKQRAHRPGLDKACNVAEMCTATGCATSRCPGSYGCTQHPDAGAEVVPPPRKRG
jgi:VRR-NUC domain-containing protein